jgi:hypothetical protein
MPNWVNNVLKVVKGDSRELFEVVRSEESVFDFNTLVPMPDRIANSNEEVEICGSKVPAWYDWSWKSWGTKWNAHNSKYSANYPDSVIYFDTAWDPPIPVFKALAKRFPRHEVVIYADEYSNHLHFTFTLKDGEVTCMRDPCRCFAPEMEEATGGDGIQTAACETPPTITDEKTT